MKLNIKAVIHYSQDFKSTSCAEMIRTGLGMPGLLIVQEQSSRASQSHCLRLNAPKYPLKLPPQPDENEMHFKPQKDVQTYTLTAK